MSEVERARSKRGRAREETSTRECWGRVDAVARRGGRANGRLCLCEALRRVWVGGGVAGEGRGVVEVDVMPVRRVAFANSALFRGVVFVVAP